MEDLSLGMGKDAQLIPAGLKLMPGAHFGAPILGFGV